jgi:hypothetical protein
MSHQGRGVELPASVREELERVAQHVQTPSAARRLWDLVFSEADRRRLGGDFMRACQAHGAAGMWQKLRGVSGPRAVLDVAAALSIIDPATHRGLLRAVGEPGDDPEDALAAALKTAVLVLTERPRAAYWKGKPIPVDWDNHGSPWALLWELGRQAKRGAGVDHTCFSQEYAPGYPAKMKSRLKGLTGFPASLAGLIGAAGRGTQRLDLTPEQVRLLEIDTVETVREYLG